MVARWSPKPETRVQFPPFLGLCFFLVKILLNHGFTLMVSLFLLSMQMFEINNLQNFFFRTLEAFLQVLAALFRIFTAISNSIVCFLSEIIMLFNSSLNILSLSSNSLRVSSYNSCSHSLNSRHIYFLIYSLLSFSMLQILILIELCLSWFAFLISNALVSLNSTNFLYSSSDISIFENSFTISSSNTS